MRKICVVITARPSYSRIKTALQAIKNHQKLELQIVLAGSALLEKYGNVSKIIEKDGFKVDEKIYNVIEGEFPTAMAKTTGIAITELATTFYNLKPDIVVTIADRFETIATSIASSYQNIPLAHIQGGEVTGNIDEKVRHANTKLADIHLVASEDAKKRVIKMGENPDMVFNTGCPSIDLAKEVLDNSFLDFNPIEKYGGVGAKIDYKNGYLVVMNHPVTTEYTKAKEQVFNLLEVINELNIPTFWFWPNVDAGSDGTSKGIRQFREKRNPKNIRFMKNMEPNDFLKLIYNSKVLIGNSSVGIRESSFLGIPVINIGSRQDGRSRGKNVIDVKEYQKEDIKKAIIRQIENGKYQPEKIYGDGKAGEKIADVLEKVELRFHKRISY